MSSREEEMDISKAPAQRDTLLSSLMKMVRPMASPPPPPFPPEPSTKPEEARQEVMKGDERCRKWRIKGEMKVKEEGWGRGRFFFSKP